MKINPINFYNYNTNNFKKDQAITTPKEFQSRNEISEFPVSYANINFCGKNMVKMWEEYNWYIRNDKTPAILSFLKIKETPEVMEEFLTAILKTEDRSRELLCSIAQLPRKAGEIRQTLSQILPSNSKLLLPFLSDSPYNVAYNKFIDYKVATAHNLEELLKIRPDWRGEVLLNKYQNLRGNKNVEIGNIPKEIPPTHLFQIVDYLSDKMEFGMKSHKQINSLTLDNRTYEFAYFTEGKSDKNVFGLFTPEGKKYVLKMSLPERRSLDAPFALGTLAKIDSYLTYNRSRNSAPLCYYNHEKNFSIYKYIEHVPAERTYNLSTITKNIPDFTALGLSYNDTQGEKNYFLMDRSSNADLHSFEGFQDGINRREWISVDNDHVTYTNILQPPITKYHASLPVGIQTFN